MSGFDSSSVIDFFLDEAGEYIQGLTNGFLAMGDNPADQATIHELFRLAHTLKGSSAMMGFNGVSRIAHKMEDILGKARSGSLVLAEEYVDVLFDGLDAIKDRLERIRAGEEEETEEPADLLLRLEAASGGSPAAPPAPPKPMPPVHAAPPQAAAPPEPLPAATAPRATPVAARPSAASAAAVPAAPPPVGPSPLQTMPQAPAGEPVHSAPPPSPGAPRQPGTPPPSGPVAGAPRTAPAAPEVKGSGSPAVSAQTPSPQATVEQAPKKKEPSGLVEEAGSRLTSAHGVALDDFSNILEVPIGDDSPSGVLKVRNFFVEEALEHIAGLKSVLDELRFDLSNQAMCVKAEKIARTMKGSAIMLGFERLGRVADKVERLFEIINSGSGSLDYGILNILYDIAEAIGKTVKDIEAGRPERVNILSFINRINPHLRSMSDSSGPSVKPSSPDSPGSRTPPSESSNRPASETPKHAENAAKDIVPPTDSREAAPSASKASPGETKEKPAEVKAEPAQAKDKPAEAKAEAAEVKAEPAEDSVKAKPVPASQTAPGRQPGTSAASPEPAVRVAAPAPAVSPAVEEGGQPSIEPASARAKGRLPDFFLQECADSLDRLNECACDLEMGGDVQTRISEIYRISHTLKGSAAMIGVQGLARLAGAAEECLARVRSGDVIFTQDNVEALFEAADKMKSIVEEADRGLESDGVEDAVVRLNMQFLGKVEVSAPQPRPQYREAPREEVNFVPPASMETPSPMIIRNIPEESPETMLMRAPSVTLDQIDGAMEDETSAPTFIHPMIIRNIPDEPAVSPRPAVARNADIMSKAVVSGEVPASQTRPGPNFDPSSPIPGPETAGPVFEMPPHASGAGSSMRPSVSVHVPVQPEPLVPAQGGATLAGTTPQPQAAGAESVVPADSGGAFTLPSAAPSGRIVSGEPAAGPKAAGAPAQSRFMAAASRGAAPQPRAQTSMGASTVRVDIDKLDSLLNLLGELVIHKIRLDQRVDTLGSVVERLNINQSKLFYLGRDLDEFRSESDLRSTYVASLDSEYNEALIGSSRLHQFTEFDEFSLDMVKIIQAMSDISQELDQLADDLNFSILNVGKITNELQEKIMKVRMLPVQRVFEKFPRVVRDLSRKLGKKIKLQIEGEETELDKTVLEKIGDPLMHLLRNTIDHGIELPDERISAGKDPEGQVTLKAYYRGNHIFIEVSDDGRGISPARIRRAIQEKGLLNDSDASKMTDSEVIKVIFQPGFSTAEKVTDVSGRGVGMDVVKNNIELLKGVIDIDSTPGRGTSFIIKLPLTLAIIQALIVEASGQKFCIPLSSVLETLKIGEDEIEEVGDKEVIFLRDEVISLVYLGSALGLGNRSDTGEKKYPVVIVSTASEKLGLVVDHLYGKQEIVIKTLGDFLEKVPNVTGATILGDGQVMLIVDVSGIINQANRIGGSLFHLKVTEEAPEKRRRTIMVVDDSLTIRNIERNLLQSAGYGVVTAENGLEALEKLHYENVDLLITDVEMPKMNGYTLTREVRSDPKLKNIPIIMITTKSQEADRLRGIKAGADVYIGKPFIQATLLDTIAKMLDRESQGAATGGAGNE